MLREIKAKAFKDQPLKALQPVPDGKELAVVGMREFLQKINKDYFIDPKKKQIESLKRLGDPGERGDILEISDVRSFSWMMLLFFAASPVMLLI